MSTTRVVKPIAALSCVVDVFGLFVVGFALKGKKHLKVAGPVVWAGFVMFSGILLFAARGKQPKIDKTTVVMVWIALVFLVIRLGFHIYATLYPDIYPDGRLRELVRYGVGAVGLAMDAAQLFGFWLYLQQTENSLGKVIWKVLSASGRALGSCCGWSSQLIGGIRERARRGVESSAQEGPLLPGLEGLAHSRAGASAPVG